MNSNRIPLKVFLCHASTDKPKVRDLYRYLKRRGIQPWFDEEHLVGGQDWQVEIPKALTTSDAILICLTKNSVDKEGYIQKEIKFALDKALEMPEGRIFLIPIKFEECEIPFTLSHYQWVDLTIESGYAKMMKALKFRASQLERSTVEISKKDVEEGNIVREQKEREAAERAERERIEKELREKQTHQASKKAKRESEKKEYIPVKSKVGSQIAYWLGGVIVLALGITLLSSLNDRLFTPQSTPKNTQTQTIATLTKDTVEPSTTTISKSTLTPANTQTPTPLPIEITEIVDDKAVPMIYVPEGSFIANGLYGTVELNMWSFYIDKFEVTNALYKKCLDARTCTELYDSTYLNDANYANHPVVYLYPYQADAFCKWRGAKLPTGTQWEKAARGTDGRLYPWGNNADNSRANFFGVRDGFVMTAPVGSFDSGVSPYGVYDMAGNVEELTSDVDENYSGGSRSSRGTSWQDDGGDPYWIYNDHYNYNTGSSVNDHTGFRCARDVTP